MTLINNWFFLVRKIIQTNVENLANFCKYCWIDSFQILDDICANFASANSRDKQLIQISDDFDRLFRVLRFQLKIDEKFIQFWMVKFGCIGVRCFRSSILLEIIEKIIFRFWIVSNGFYYLCFLGKSGVFILTFCNLFIPFCAKF